MFARIRFALEMLILLNAAFIKAAPLMFPLTLGGFKNDTFIEKIVLTENHKILIEAVTLDPSIIDTTYYSVGNFLAYFDYPDTKDYLWKKQYYSASGILEVYVDSMDVN